MVKFTTPFAALLPLALAGLTKAVNNGLARTPQMGWNTWNTFACDIDENTILSAARAIKDEGLDKFGYEYVVIDDCWQAEERDPETKRIPAHPTKFPRGLKAVVDDIKALGLKAGIYSSAGVMTCGRHLGSLDYEEVDAQAWAEDGFEYLKYDNCFNQGRQGTPQISFDRYNKMSQALNKTGQPILYSMCNWGEDWPWLFAQEIANSWRMSGDIFPAFDKDDDRCPCTDITNCNLHGFHCSIAKILDFAAPLGQKAAPGSWNDLDMLEVGNTGLSLDESLVHFSMWSMVKSPLILGNDVTKMTNQTRAIITNKHVIDLSQDPTGSPAIRLYKKDVSGGGNVQLWKMALANGTYAVAAANFAKTPQQVTIDFDDVFFDEWTEDEPLRDEAWDAFDLWAGVDFKKYNPEPKPFSQIRVDGAPFKKNLPEVSVPAHGIKLYKLAPAGTNGLGMSDEEMKKRDVERKANVRMGRAKEWMEMRADRILNIRGL